MMRTMMTIVNLTHLYTEGSYADTKGYFIQSFEVQILITAFLRPSLGRRQVSHNSKVYDAHDDDYSQSNTFVYGGKLCRHKRIFYTIIRSTDTYHCISRGQSMEETGFAQF